MNVLHLSSEKSWRGGEQQIAYLIEELRKSGINNHVLCRANTPFETWCQDHKIDYQPAAFANQFDLSTALKLKAYCRKKKIDIIHAHSSHSHALCIWSAMLGNRTPVILSRRVDFPVSNNWLSRLKYRHPIIKKVICVSDKVKEIVSPALRSPAHATTVYDGIDFSRFKYSNQTGKLHREFKLPKDIILIGNASAITQQKDYFTFVNTVEILVKAGIHAHYFIIGKGNQEAEIREYIAQKQLNSNITLTGFRNDIADILPELDVFLMTSETEGLGSTLLDAFACRVPVVATAAGGIPEIVHHRLTGLIAPVADAPALARNVEELLEDPALRERLVERAHASLPTFSKENMALQTLGVYRRVLGQPL